MPGLKSQSGVPMSSLERMLIQACRCGKQMRLASPTLVPEPDQTHINVYHCANCGSETRVTVWGCDV
jgi:hypothetical protein